MWKFTEKERNLLYEIYKEMQAMGKNIIPLIMEKLLDEDNFFLLPLYDAMNEKGVAMAGLNFVGNAVYAAIKYN